MARQQAPYAVKINKSASQGGSCHPNNANQMMHTKATTMRRMASATSATTQGQVLQQAATTRLRPGIDTCSREEAHSCSRCQHTLLKVPAAD